MQYNDCIHEVITGVVEENRDPLDLGRIKVSFPRLTEPGAASRWARLALLMPSTPRGNWATLEVGREVLVAFEHDDLDRPVVIGMLWNKEDVPPNAEGSDAIRSFRSRSGHRVVLDDSEDKPSILIVDKTEKNSLFIDSARNRMVIKVEGDLTIQVGGKITITAQAGIDVDSDADLSVAAEGNGDLHTAGPLNIRSSVKLGLDGTSQAELKAAWSRSTSALRRKRSQAMGQPAARMGDMTAHGGTIILGCPTVLIGGIPAARVGDMRTCPMVTGSTSHVGGPILPPGSPTVLIGGLPAARMGDLAACTGPADTILPPGCPTVLIGS